MSENTPKTQEFTFNVPYDALPVLKMAATSLVRPVLSGAYIDAERGMIATADGFRMGFLPVKLPENARSCIIPAADLLEGFKLAGVRNAEKHGIDVLVKEDNDVVIMTANGKSLTSTLIVGTYPDVMQIFDGSSVALRVFIDPGYLKE